MKKKKNKKKTSERRKGKDRRRGGIAPIYDRLVSRNLLPNRRKGDRRKKKRK